MSYYEELIASYGAVQLIERPLDALKAVCKEADRLRAELAQFKAADAAKVQMLASQAKRIAELTRAQKGPDPVEPGPDLSPAQETASRPAAPERPPPAPQ